MSCLRPNASPTSCDKSTLNERVNTSHPRGFVVQARHHAEILATGLDEGLTEFDLKFFQGLEPIHDKGRGHDGDIGDASLRQVHHGRRGGRGQPLDRPNAALVGQLPAILRQAKRFDHGGRRHVAVVRVTHGVGRTRSSAAVLHFLAVGPSGVRPTDV